MARQSIIETAIRTTATNKSHGKYTSHNTKREQNDTRKTRCLQQNVFAKKSLTQRTT